MKDTRWRTWEIIGLFWTLAAGNLLHFVYDWTGSSVAAALFSAVNESTWEHMKLLAVPWILFSLVEYIVLRSGGIAGPRAVGLLVGLAAIPLLFYGYKGVVGQGNMIVDILIFQVSVLLSFWVSWSLQKRRRLSGAGWTVLGLLVLLGVWALFLPVSYTHLDVYKRQGGGLRLGAGERRAGCLCGLYASGSPGQNIPCPGYNGRAAAMYGGSIRPDPYQQ